MYNLTLDQIFSEDGGERYILDIYPELEPCFKNKSIKVKLRDDDKTASAGVYKHKSGGIWLINDFGGGADSKALTAFKLCQQINKCDSGEAFKILAKFYGHDLKVEIAKADYSSRMPKPGELAKSIVNITFGELEYHEVLTILSRYAWEGIEWGGVHAKDDKERLNFARALFKYYNFRAVKSYEQVNSDGTIVHIYTATESFPMFAIDEGTFQKLYKPKAEKKFRFMWSGNKPENYVHGLKQHTAYLDNNKNSNSKKKSDAEEHSEKAAEKESKKELLQEKFKEIILVSGGSDALNVAAIGYRAIWLNSETANLDYKTIYSLKGMCYDFYNLPDIDATGRTGAMELAWNHIDIKTIWLPAELALKSDGKGGHCKDVRDYLKFNKKSSFKKLVSNALPFQFWDEMDKKDKEGNAVFKFGRPVVVYEFNNVRGYNFLQMNGFWRFADLKFKEGYRLIKLTGNKVRDVLANEVKNYIHSFLKERQLNEDLRNVMYKSPQLNESSISNLDEIDLDFKHFGHNYQYVFFADKTWKITAEGIEAVKMPNIYVWDHKILEPIVRGQKLEDFKPKVLDSMFEITQMGEKDWQVDFKNMDCDFLKFTLQTCKIHWRNELEWRMEFHDLDAKEKLAKIENEELDAELVKKMDLMDSEVNQQAYFEKYRFRLDGTLLTDAEQKEQQLAFVNRIFLIGYLLHRYKDPTKPWAGFVMDYRISEEGASNGRAGKGLLAEGLKRMLSHYRIDARDPKLFENNFLWGGVDKGNELIHMEDWDEYLDFERLFNILTGALFSNAKGMQPINIDNQDFGKFLIDTNYSDRYMSGSAKGRKLHSVFADFYHEDREFYREVRTPATELKRRMFDDWDGEEWNKFYNFMSQCLKFYLSVAEKGLKIDPPFSNIIKRNSLSIMGENFRHWADNYFELRMDEIVERKTAYEDFMKSANMQKISPQSFLKKLVAWADFMNYRFNPEHVQGWQKAGEGKKYGYIKRSVPVLDQQGKYTTIEYLYIELGSSRANLPNSISKNQENAPGIYDPNLSPI